MGAYGIYVDGNLVGRQASEIVLPAGEHEVIVAVPGQLGDQPHELFQISVLPDAEVSVEIKPPDNDQSESSSRDQNTNQGATEAELSTKTGTLEVTSLPTGAEVYLDQSLLGTTPLSLLSVPISRYELSVRKPLLESSVQVVDITEAETTSVDVEMDVALDDPEVQDALIPVWRPSVVALAWTFIEGGIATAMLSLDIEMTDRFTVLSNIDPDIVLLESMIVLGRMGHYAANANREALRVSIASFALYTTGRALTWLYYNLGVDTDTPGMILTASAPILSILYDIGFSPLAASRSNDRLLAGIEAGEGIPAVERNDFRSWIVRTGANTLLSVGYALPFFSNLFAIEFLAGVALAGIDPISLGPVVTMRGAVYPFRDSIRRFAPFAFLSSSIESDLQQIGGRWCFGFGYDIPTRWFEVSVSSGLALSFGTKKVNSQMSVGVRI